MRPYLAIIALGAALAGPALAAPADDEVIATAQAKPSAEALAAQAPPAPVPTTTAAPLTTQQQIDNFIYHSPPMDDEHRGILPAGLSDDDRDADGKRKVHGSMGVSVGTGGYRSGYASALIPVGESTTVGIAVSKTDFGKRGGYYADPYYGGGGYYGGFGTGYGYGPGYGRTRGGSQQSVALSVMTGNASRSGDAPDGCAPGFRDGGRYVEPLWVDGMRDGAHPCSAAASR
ncbi:hypothetical protein [Caulobacter sp.]|uniref:hypothetical protein n=1 Tax=Caulobacter sp. TaxID=78 RepID=UPI001B0315E6|nr:hypothetical protein [Caulobacter sp.]MBO9544092.1 hypothetical protein [Caulobacter sp.]